MSVDGIQKRTVTTYRVKCKACPECGPVAHSADEAIEAAKQADWYIRHITTLDDGTPVRDVMCPTCIERYIEENPPDLDELAGQSAAAPVTDMF
jgi:hypothetical protein